MVVILVTVNCYINEWELKEILTKYHKPRRWSPECFWGPAGLRSLPARQKHTPKGWLWTWSPPASYWTPPLRDRGSLGDGEEQNVIRKSCSLLTVLFDIEAALTDGGKDVGETEVVHGIEGQEVVEKLLLLIITAEEGVSLVQFSKKENFW